jgi:hypothetical protein
MSMPPLSSLLIAAGLVLFSVVVVNRVKGTTLFARRSFLIIAFVAGSLFAAGLFLHLRMPLGTGAHPQVLGPTVPFRSSTAQWIFSFEPKTVRWGEDVQFHVTPAIDKIEVYLNGNPLPSRTIRSGVFVVTIPTISKSGYFTLNCAGTKVRATAELIVSPR